MNHVAKRTLTGVSVGVGVIAIFLWCPLRAVLPIVVMLSALVQLEFYQMAKVRGPATMFGIALGTAWLAAVGLYGFGDGLLSLAMAFPAALVLASFAVCAWVLFQPRFTKPISSVATTLFGVLYVPFMLGFFLLTVQLGARGVWGGVPDTWTRHGLYTLLALVATAKFSDTGGFAFGMAFGKHKMCPTISPKKSWEGLVGSMLFSAATACVFLALARRFGWGETVRFWDALTYPGACACGAATALVATAGDLVESRFKRACGVKDSATFMPAGMGGFLDMFDSILFIPALVYFPIFYFNAHP
jgi:phosphatidate cytidylyltransferase